MKPSRALVLPLLMAPTTHMTHTRPTRPRRATDSRVHDGTSMKSRCTHNRGLVGRSNVRPRERRREERDLSRGASSRDLARTPISDGKVPIPKIRREQNAAAPIHGLVTTPCSSIQHAHLPTGAIGPDSPIVLYDTSTLASDALRGWAAQMWHRCPASCCTLQASYDTWERSAKMHSYS
ncbi:hypothetical protein H4582DRAFT_389335 [Lactarius indigo]|nr:hypothetical protein H4582DRAFT_389335 [Lactarius indigo]